MIKDADFLLLAQKWGGFWKVFFYCFTSKMFWHAVGILASLQKWYEHLEWQSAFEIVTRQIRDVGVVWLED